MHISLHMVGESHDFDSPSQWSTKITSLFPFKSFHGSVFGGRWVHHLPRLPVFWLKSSCLSINVCVYWFYKQQVCQGCILSPCLFNLYAECIRKNAKQDEDKCLYCQSYGFSIVMYRCESWTTKKTERQRTYAFELWCWRKEDSWESLGDQRHWKETKPAVPKGNQPWICIGRTDSEAEAPILFPPDAKSWFIVKDPNAGKYWRKEEKGATENEMVRWHHRLNGHGFEKILGDS